MEAKIKEIREPQRELNLTTVICKKETFFDMHLTPKTTLITEYLSWCRNQIVVKTYYQKMIILHEKNFQILGEFADILELCTLIQSLLLTDLTGRPGTAALQERKNTRPM